jgi:hypothetical protein
MKVHAFAAKHALIYRMVLITFQVQLSVTVLMYDHTATHATITTGGAPRLLKGEFCCIDYRI